MIKHHFTGVSVDKTQNASQQEYKTQNASQQEYKTQSTKILLTK